MCKIIKLRPANRRRPLSRNLDEAWMAEAGRMLDTYAGWLWDDDIPGWVGDQWSSYIKGVRYVHGWEKGPEAVDWPCAWEGFTAYILASHPLYREQIERMLREVGAE